jgi:iduronate 2-sulfatase
VPDEAYPDGFLATEAIRRLSEAKKRSDTPFFIGLGFAKPHLPFCAPKKYWDMHDPAKLPLATVTEPPLGAPSYAPQFGGELRSYGGIPANGALPTDCSANWSMDTMLPPVTWMPNWAGCWTNWTN